VFKNSKRLQMLKTPEYIQSRLEEMASFIETTYQTDEIGQLLERSQKAVSYQSECSLLVNDAFKIKCEKELQHQNELATIRKLLCFEEIALYNKVNDVRSALKQVVRITQSQMAVWRADMDSHKFSKS
jgi:hypothetical protein